MFPSIKILEYLKKEIHLKITCDDNHNIIKIKEC